jgi:hypothetical protein
MEAILELPSSLPEHIPAALKAVPARIVSEWPAGTFVENLAVLDDGSVAVSVLSEARVDRVTLDGERSVLHQFAAPTTGLAVMHGHLFVAVGAPGAGAPTLWRIDPQSRDVQPWMIIEGSVFINGVAAFDNTRLIAADSWHGALLLLDFETRSTSVWLQDERLTRAPECDMLPGANGVKRYRNEITVSSNGRALLLRAPIRSDGSASSLELIADKLRVDDLAYDQTGNLYLCTHIGASLDRLTREGERVSLAGVAQGLAGSTACAFGRTNGHRDKLYVTTTGGILLPVDGQVQPAKLIELNVGAEGYTLELPSKERMR